MVVEAVVKYKKQREEVDKDNGFLVRNSMVCQAPTIWNRVSTKYLRRVFAVP